MTAPALEELIQKVIAVIGGGPGCGTVCDTCRRQARELIELVRNSST